jgi:hypothetical protein
MMEKPKKERRFLKTLGRVGEILIQEVLLKVGSSLIKRIGGKKTLPSILFLFISISLFAQFPNTGNKQRLGFQTTADGLVWRGSLSDTAAIQPVSNQNAWVILDTVNLKIYSFDFTSNVWNALPQGTNIDTTSLSNRIDLKVNISDTAAMLLPYFKDADTSLLNLVSRFALKLNISDTAAMLLPYATKAYADTTGRLYARQDYTTGVTTSTLTWTQTDTLIPGGVTFIQVYRNGQILLPSQYTVPTSTSVVISASSFKVNDNYTVIFPRGGGAGSGGGSGSLTSISGGTGIIVNPNPITTTGTVSADLSVLMELTDTSLLNLTTRFATKLNAADTASLSTRIDAKGTGTVTSVGSGFGLLGGTITTTGTLRLDTSTIYARLQDSINVAIGGDTIKILKQEYQPALSSVLTWTITPKFPIQLKAYILVFRNGQLLNNDQYNLTDTNKITIVSTSFKVGANYTVATVSGIGSVGSAQSGNPIYPEAGIALSTGTTWASSITNNSANWNTAYNDKINSLAVTGITTKTITLTQQDGGTVSGNFTDNGSVTSVDMTVPTGLAISGQPITTSGTLALSYASGYSIPTDIKQNEWNTAYNDKINNAAFTGTNTKTLTLTQLDGGTLTPTFTDLQGVTSVTAGTGLTSGTITTTGTLAVDFGVVAPLANPTFTGTVGGITKSMVGLGNVDNTSDANKPISSATQTALNLKQNTLNGTGFVKASGTNITYDNSSYLRTGLADSTYLKLTGGTLTGALNVNATSTLNFTNIYGKNTYVPFNVGLGEQSIFNVGAYLRGGTVMIFPDSSLAGSSANLFFANSSGVGDEFSARGSGIRNYTFQTGDKNRNSLALYTSDIGQQNTNRLYINYNGNIGINDDTPSFKLDVNGTLGVTGAATLSSTLAVTEAVTLSTTSATPTSLLGKDGSNVVGSVTTVAQTGLFGRGSVTNRATDANGNITVAHGFNFTPIMAFANLPGQTTNIINVKSVDGTNIVFVVRDGPTNDVLNTISVAKIEFFAIK